MNPKLKSENYTNFGGINSKFSPYVTGPMEFLDIANYDFQYPGDLTQRWGSTQYVGQTVNGAITGLFEYSQTSGFSQVIFSATGGIWAGATTGNSQGLSLTNVGSTTVYNGRFMYTSFAAGTIVNIAGPARYLVNNDPAVVLNAGSAGGAGNTFYIASQTQSGNRQDMEELVNEAFIADANKFIKYNGVSTSLISLPPVSLFNGPTVVTTTAMPLGMVYFGAASYVNDRGFEGPVWPVFTTDATLLNGTTVASTGQGTTFGYGVGFNAHTPLALGISSINVYLYAQAASVGAFGTSAFSYNYSYIANFPASGSTITYIEFGITGGFVEGSTFNPIGSAPPGTSYLPMGMTVGSKNFGPPFVAMTNNNNPSMLEIFQNRLMMAGISMTPSTIWFSDTAEPEGIQPDWNFEVRTNDADYVTAMRSYQGRMYVFKKNSFHVLSGDSPDNFFLQEVSRTYGCLNKDCVAVFNDYMVFLDRKGIILFNGSGIDSNFSTKVQPYFDILNVDAAILKATMIHDKLRNQILISLPIGTSGANNTNNFTIVYDYVAGAWTTQYGYNASVFAEVQGRNDSRRTFYGSYSGMISWFGPSFTQDNGAGITLYLKTRFLHDLGESSEKQFRRLYLNADQRGTTIGLVTKFYQDYGTSVVLSTTFTLGAFQDRIDFGIPAKALAFELFGLSQTSPLRLHGFTIESRLQRRV